MDDADYSSLEALYGDSLERFKKTFHEVSASEPNPDGIVNYCVEDKGVGKKSVLWFDGLMDVWADIGARRLQHLPQSRRIDACYKKDMDWYLVEFKCDGDLAKFRDALWLKYMDSLTQLLAHGWLTLQIAIEHLYYIVVTSTRLRYSIDDIHGTDSEKSMILLKITNPMSDWAQRPWKYKEIISRCGLWQFEGVTCKKTMTISSSQFDRFAQDNHWV